MFDNLPNTLNAGKPSNDMCKPFENLKTPLKPFVKWAGGKAQLTKKLDKLFNAENGKLFTKYCEPMVGGGAALFYFLTKYSFDSVYINDKNKELINAYAIIRDSAEDLILLLKDLQAKFWKSSTQERTEFYYNIRDKFNSSELTHKTKLEKAAFFIFLNKTCFNGLYRVNKNGKFNVPIGLYKNPLICDEANLRNISNALKKVIICCGDYSSSKEFIDENTFVYFDPPYRPVSSTSDFTSYNAENFDDDEQIRLAKYINDLDAVGARIVLSNSDPKNNDLNDNFFDELYKKYNILRVSANRMINSVAENRGRINELLIFNGTNIMERNFDEWIRTFKTSISDYNYYVDFEKVYTNADKFKIELNILNSLIGSKDIETDFKNLLLKYPQILGCLPILLAVRSREIHAIDGDGEFVFNFKKQNYTATEYAMFMRKTGLFDLISNRIISNLLDYVMGVEVGLDSNSRKNRGGHLMENLLEDYLIKAGLVKDETYFKEMRASVIQQKWNIDLSGLSNKGKTEKKFDFVVKCGATVFAIETNFYNVQGSKLNETARSYKTLALEARSIENFRFVWFTDGYDGWKGARHNLEETFDVLDDLYCINDLENGILKKLFN